MRIATLEEMRRRLLKPVHCDKCDGKHRAGDRCPVEEDDKLEGYHSLVKGRSIVSE